MSKDGKKWIGTPSTFLFPEAVASPIYRQKFREILPAADIEKHVDPTVWRKWWEVSVKPVSDGRAVLKYLAPYVFRVAISDNRILECTDESVTYKYTPSGTKTTKTRTVDGVKFVRGFLQHTLPPCPHCGEMLHLIAITDGTGRVLVSRALPQVAMIDHATNYLDSG